MVRHLLIGYKDEYGVFWSSFVETGEVRNQFAVTDPDGVGEYALSEDTVRSLSVFDDEDMPNGLEWFVTPVRDETRDQS